jgi:hypothetical protein
MVLTTAALLGLESYWIGLPLAAVLVLWLWPQRYITSGEGIEIRAGLAHRFIPYEAIRFVGPCTGGRNLALAIHGVSIRYGIDNEIRIAPEDSAAFLASVAAKAPHLIQRGASLVLGLA